MRNGRRRVAEGIGDAAISGMAWLKRWELEIFGSVRLRVSRVVKTGVLAEDPRCLGLRRALEGLFS